MQNKYENRRCSVFQKNTKSVENCDVSRYLGAYPQPIVDHSFARDRALKTYSDAVKENQQY